MLTKAFVIIVLYIHVLLGMFDGQCVVLQVTLESRFKEDLELDSLDHVEVIMAIEDEFGKQQTSIKQVLS